jgi:hypothetical protein
MIDNKLHIPVFVATTLGFGMGLIPGLGNVDLLVQLTPSGPGLATRLGSDTAAGFNLALLFTVIAVVLYSITNRRDDEAIALFEWYGCLIFGGALAVSMFGLAAVLWSDSFPRVKYGRAARALYHLASSNALWLYIGCLLFFLVGGAGLYLLARVPQLLRQRFL